MGTQSETEPQRALPPDARLHPRLKKHTVLAGAWARDVTVYLPPGYDGHEERRYPLLILQDGQNLFDPETSFIRGKTWRVAESADAAIAAGTVKPLVIAGVANAGERRMVEYTPVRDGQLGGGEARQYGALLTRELLPFLRETYRLRAGAEDTGLGGSSLGGLFSLWLGLQEPEIFGKLAVLSPSVWWSHKFILGYVNETAAKLHRRPRLWLDVGDQEGRRTLADAELLHTQLRANGWRDGADLHFEKVAGGTHDEAAWAQRVRPMLQFLFPAQRAADSTRGG